MDRETMKTLGSKVRKAEDIVYRIGKIEEDKTKFSKIVMSEELRVRLCYEEGNRTNSTDVTLTNYLDPSCIMAIVDLIKKSYDKKINNLEKELKDI